MILERERATALRRDAMQNPKDFDPAFLHEQSNEHRSSRGGLCWFSTLKSDAVCKRTRGLAERLSPISRLNQENMLDCTCDPWLLNSIRFGLLHD